LITDMRESTQRGVPFGGRQRVSRVVPVVLPGWDGSTEELTRVFGAKVSLSDAG
jgi:hypothetical protein